MEKVNYEMLLDHLPGAIVIDMEGIVLYLNDQCASYIEVDREWAVSKHISVVFPQTKMLENLHIEEIEADAKPFDPNVMNAVSQVPAPEGVESGTVVTVYQKGYRIGDKIIRHATVVVAE